MREDGDLLLRAVVRNLETGVENTLKHPKQFVLKPNYPNPFNSSTTLSFELLQRGFYVLDIFDVQGTLVQSWPFSDMPAGPYSVVWDGRKSTGEPAHSGIYVVRLSGQHQQASRRIVLVK